MIFRYRMHDRKCNKIILINKWHKYYLKKLLPCDCQLRKLLANAVQLNVDIKQLWNELCRIERERELDSPIMFIFIFSCAHLHEKSIYHHAI